MMYLYNGTRWEWKKGLEPGWYPNAQHYREAMGPPPASSTAEGTAKTETIQVRREAIRHAVAFVIEGGNEDDLMTTGAPKVRAVEQIVEFDITSDERDEAFADVQHVATEQGP